jgi:hypothetical protein
MNPLVLLAGLCVSQLTDLCNNPTIFTLDRPIASHETSGTMSIKIITLIGVSYLVTCSARMLPS